MEYKGVNGNGYRPLQRGWKEPRAPKEIVVRMGVYEANFSAVERRRSRAQGKNGFRFFASAFSSGNRRYK